MPEKFYYLSSHLLNFPLGIPPGFFCFYSVHSPSHANWQICLLFLRALMSPPISHCMSWILSLKSPQHLDNPAFPPSYSEFKTYIFSLLKPYLTSHPTRPLPSIHTVPFMGILLRIHSLVQLFNKY